MRRFGLVIAMMLFASGVSGLVYEVVWLRMLNRAFGVTIYAVSTILCVFMGGLALGSVIAGKRVRSAAPLRWYAYAEWAIGASAMLSTWLISLLPDLMRAIGPIFRPDLRVLVYFVLAAVVLLPPTFAMGTTLPLLTAFMTEDGRVGKSAGLLYGANTLGAVAGVLGTGFLLLMWLGEIRTIVLGVAINSLLGVVAILLDRRPRAPSSTSSGEVQARSPLPWCIRRRALMLTVGVSGACALACEVIWSRLLTLLLGNSVYGFAFMLGAYLLGIGAGSLLMSRIIERITRPVLVFALLQMSIASLALLSLRLFTELGLAHHDIKYVYSQIWSIDDFPRLAVHALVIVLPVTLLLGATFPVTTMLALGERGSAESVGDVYGANTAGSIAGSVLTGFVLVPLLGTLKSFLVVAGVWFFTGLYLLRIARAEESRVRRPVGWALGVAFTALLSVSFEDPFFTVLRSRINAQDEVLAYDEDRAATILALRARPPADPDSNVRHLFINGLIVSSTDPAIGATMMNLPLSFQPRPKSSLIVGLGVGEAFKASLDLGLSTTVVELVPKLRDYFTAFHPGEDAYLGNENAHIVFDDGRNHLLSTRESYDLIFVDGTPPVFASGMVNLYSREFLEIARDHLTPDGVYAVWFPTYCFESDFWNAAQALAVTYPHVTVWAHPGWSGMILLGTKSETAFATAPEVVDQRLKERGVAQRFPAIDARFLLSSLLPEDKLRARAAMYPPLTDDRPTTEFPLLRFMRREVLLPTNDFLLGLRADR
jgi:spermidine synthase